MPRCLEAGPDRQGGGLETQEILETAERQARAATFETPAIPPLAPLRVIGAPVNVGVPPGAVDEPMIPPVAPNTGRPRFRAGHRDGPVGSNSVQVATGVAIARSGVYGNLQALGKSDAALVAGALLAIEGLRRGGAVGVAETTAGGALIGFKFGGPIGEAIGASAGFFAGIVRLFIKGATEKVREEIKTIYGVDISDKAILRQIVDTAKQAFGGNLDVAVRSPQIRDLIELYAMSTGQNMLVQNKPRPTTLVELGGSLYQAPTFINGSASAFQSSLPTLGRHPSTGSRAGVPQNAGHW